MNRTIYIDNLKYEQKQRYISENIEVLTPQEIFDEKLEDTDALIVLEDTDALIVLCELNVDKDGNKINRSDFYGVKLVQELRKDYKFKGIVLFVSFLPKKIFLDSKVKYGIVSFNRGHSFLRLPVNIDKLKDEVSQIIKLDYLSFRDVQLFGSDIRGTVSESLHALDSINIDYEKNHKKLLIQVCEYFDISSIEIIQQYEEINTSKQEKLSFVKTECTKLLNKYLSDSINKYEMTKYNWSILWLDDEVKNKEDNGESIPIIKHLREERKIDIIVAGNYEKAFGSWEEDRAKENKIMVIVADYRLQTEKEEGVEYNINQGYHFIQEIIERDNTVSVIAYSGMPRKFLMESFIQFGKKIQFFSKIDFPIYKNSTFIGDEIVVSGDEAWLETNNQPISASWKSNDGKNTKGLKMNEVYFNFKNSVEFNAWNRICSLTTLKSLITYNEKQEFTNFNISGSTFTSSPSKQLPKLKDILIARRFAITELAKADNNENDIIGRKKEIGDYIFRCSNKNKEPNDKSADAVFNRLALTPAFFPMFLLPEEYSWLKYESGLNFDTSKIIDNYFLELKNIKNIFKTAIEKYPKGLLESLIDESFYKISKANINENLSKEIFSNDESEKWFYFNDELEPQVRTISEVKVILEYIYYNLDINNGNYKEHLSEFVYVLRKLRLFAKQTNFKSFKTIQFFVNQFPVKSKNIPNILKNIDEEYSYLIAPWEFRFQYNLRINSDYQRSITNLCNLCKEAVNGNIDFIINLSDTGDSKKKKIIKDENLETLFLAKKNIDLEMFNEILKDCEDKNTIFECNNIIYNKIISSLEKRRNAFNAYLTSKNLEIKESNPKLKATSPDENIKYKITSEIKDILNITNNEFNSLDIRFFSMDKVKGVTEIELDFDTNFISLIAFSYNADNYLYFIRDDYSLLSFSDFLGAE